MFDVLVTVCSNKYMKVTTVDRVMPIRSGSIVLPKLHQTPHSICMQDRANITAYYSPGISDPKCATTQRVNAAAGIAAAVPNAVGPQSSAILELKFQLERTLLSLTERG